MVLIDEFTIQKTFVDWARKQEYIKLCFAVPNGFQASSRAALMMKKEGLLPGVPDIFCLLDNNRWAIIEFKTEVGKVSPQQEKIIKILEEHGQAVRVCRSTREAVWFIKEISNIQ